MEKKYFNYDKRSKIIYHYNREVMERSINHNQFLYDYFIK